jgi:predicted ATP-grasp superfamily ATP-dependent carboligase
LDHFITTFHFAAHKEFSRKFEDEIKHADRNLSFANDNEAALYKLKKAHNIFFTQSLPEPLSL